MYLNLGLLRTNKKADLEDRREAIKPRWRGPFEKLAS